MTVSGILQSLPDGTVVPDVPLTGTLGNGRDFAGQDTVTVSNP